MFETLDLPSLDKTVKRLLVVWGVFLIPWPLMVWGAAMASGRGIVSEIVFYSVLAYPILFMISFIYRREKPRLVWLPALSFVGVFLSTIADDLLR